MENHNAGLIPSAEGCGRERTSTKMSSCSAESYPRDVQPFGELFPETLDDSGVNQDVAGKGKELKGLKAVSFRTFDINFQVIRNAILVKNRVERQAVNFAEAARHSIPAG